MSETDLTTTETEESPVDPRAVRPAAIANVIVPVSMSPLSGSAVPPAAALARRFGASLRLLTVGIERAEAEAVRERFGPLATVVQATIEQRVDWDVPGSILDVATEFAPAVVCMASHARGRLGDAALGSYAEQLLATTTNPTVLIGPAFDAHRGMADGPILACVDGSPQSETVLPVAASWALALRRGLGVVTVAEPALAGLDHRPAYRLRGPIGNPGDYVEGLASAWARPDLAVSSAVAFDPVSVGPAIATLLETEPCGLLAVATRARSGIGRIVLGSTTMSILHHSPVPLLVVPRTPR